MKKNCENCAYNDNSSRLPPCLWCTASTTNPVPTHWEAGANYEPESKTNADRIRGMSDDELAHKLLRHSRPWCGNVCDTTKDCLTCVLNWLQQPCKED